MIYMICSNCNVEMKKAVTSAATGGVFFVSDAESNKKLFSIQKSSKVNSYCCPECGKIELYAEDTSIFKDKNDE